MQLKCVIIFIEFFIANFRNQKNLAHYYGVTFADDNNKLSIPVQ